MMWLAYASAWLSTAAAVIVGLLVTGNWGLLFFMLLPLCVNIKSTKKEETENA